MAANENFFKLVESIFRIGKIKGAKVEDLKIEAENLHINNEQIITRRMNTHRVIENQLKDVSPRERNSPLGAFASSQKSMISLLIQLNSRMDSIVKRQKEISNFISVNSEDSRVKQGKKDEKMEGRAGERELEIQTEKLLKEEFEKMGEELKKTEEEDDKLTISMSSVCSSTRRQLQESFNKIPIVHQSSLREKSEDEVHNILFRDDTFNKGTISRFSQDQTQSLGSTPKRNQNTTKQNKI